MQKFMVTKHYKQKAENCKELWILIGHSGDIKTVVVGQGI